MYLVVSAMVAEKRYYYTMSGDVLEQMAQQQIKDTILQLSDFLLYMQGRLRKAELFADNQRKMNIVYHQIWYFRDKLIREYANDNNYDEFPQHLYSEYKNEAEQSLALALKNENNGMLNNVAVPDFLVGQMERVAKKIDSLDLPPEGAKAEAEFYITKENDQYFYNGEPKDFKIGKDFRLAFDILFDATGGKGGVCTYDAFIKALIKRDKATYNRVKAREDRGGKTVREWAQDNLTVKSKGVLSKVPKKDLITTEKGVGFVFNNRK